MLILKNWNNIFKISFHLLSYKNLILFNYINYSNHYLVFDNMVNENADSKAKPFLKWAGGKTQLLDEIKERLPSDICADYKYFEPFVGGGAVFFSLMDEFEFEYAYLNDVNEDLILTYNIIKEKPDELIYNLKNFKNIYDSDLVDNKKFYYSVRNNFNEGNININPFNTSSENIFRASQMIFLNKTCFNGLYRVNKSGKFNVPFASPKNPLICDEENIHEVHDALQNVELNVGDFSECKELIDSSSFVYLDPPYKPVNDKKSFEGYTNVGFDNDEQRRLARFCKDIDKKAKFLLSNSKPKDNSLFEELYHDFKTDTVSAKRSINSNGKKRGEIDELLIYNNYELIKIEK